MLPLVGFLKQGITAKKLAMAVSVGLIFGIFPVLGSTTIICAVMAMLFRVNQPAVQLVNYLVYPLQLIFIMPYIKIGEIIFKAQHAASYSITNMLIMFRQDAANAFHVMGQSMLYAIVAWAFTAPFLGMVIYFSLLPVFKKILLNKNTSL